MLTPLEIEKRKYKKEFRGYSVEEVEEFNRIIAEDYEKLYKDNSILKDKINVLSNAIKQYKSMEETLQNAIIVAQSAGEEVTKNAREKAENIIKEAENQAGRILNDAGKEVTKVSYEYEKMKRNVEVFRTKIISLLTSQLDIVKEFSMPEDEKVEEIDVETIVKDINSDTDSQGKNVQDTLKKLERVTMELPKLILNENGEYVAEESLKNSGVGAEDKKIAGAPTVDKNSDDYDEDLGF